MGATPVVGTTWRLLRDPRPPRFTSPTCQGVGRAGRPADSLNPAEEPVTKSGIRERRGSVGRLVTRSVEGLGVIISHVT